MSDKELLRIGNLIQEAIVRECSAVKLGNVHPHASFHDLNHSQFLTAAAAIGTAFDNAIQSHQGIGATILACSSTMMDQAQTNTSLGTVLLLVPLGFAWLQSETQSDDSLQMPERLQRSVSEVMLSLTSTDSAAIYEAIRVAKPGGMGQVNEMDVEQAAPPRILDAMEVASKWDDIALQYISDFQLVFDYTQQYQQILLQGNEDSTAIGLLQVRLLADRVDSLIVRKKGLNFAETVRAKASVLQQIGNEQGTQSASYAMTWQQLDDYLRDDKHQGNPGTTADLIAAVCFLSSLLA